MHVVLAKLGITRKKSFTYSEKSAKDRQAFLDTLSLISESKRVYIDECGIGKDLTREYGRAPRCKRVEDTKRGRKFHRLNVIGGLLGGLVVALFCYEYSTNGLFFEGWFENQFLPCVPVGVTIILDSASFHRKKKLSLIAERVGVDLLFLPAY